MQSIEERTDAVFDGIRGRLMLDRKAVKTAISNAQRDAIAAELLRETPIVESTSREFASRVFTEKEWANIRNRIALGLASTIRQMAAEETAREIMDLKATVTFLGVQVSVLEGMLDKVQYLIDSLESLTHLPESLSSQQNEMYQKGFEVGHLLGFRQCQGQVVNFLRRWSKEIVRDSKPSR